MRVWAWLSIAALGLTGQAGATRPDESHILIRHAQIADGHDPTIFAGDVRIAGDRIVAIGTLDPQPGETVIDAAGLVLAPGFIDTHSHHDGGLSRHRDALALVSQGVTTIVSGQDGDSDVPIARRIADRTATPTAVNVAYYSGHGTLRAAVMGTDYKREATTTELAAIKTLLDADMRAGALGLSTGLEYDPGIYASRAEVLELARVAAGQGGRYISHIRSEDRDLWGALDELIAIGKIAKLPVQLSHAKLAMTDWWGQADRMIARLDAARADGVDVSLDIYPYTNWQSVLTVMWPKRDFENRETAAFILGHLAPPEGLLISADDADASHVGKTVAQIASERGADPVTTVMALIRDSRKMGGDVHVIGTSMDERDIAKLIAWPAANICSDGEFDSLHPRGAGAFAKVLRHYVRETRLLTLGEAVVRMTGLSAQHMGLVDRGAIRPGAFADLVLFDPATIADHATTEMPRAQATGVAKVWVNGALVYEAGKATGVFPGRVIKRAGVK